MLNLLGVNGEQIAGSQVVVTYTVRGVEEEEKITLKTDENGKIKLGSLSIVK